MANIDDAFRVEQVSLDDLVLITSQTADPSTGAGYEAPVGSVYARTTGSVYVKYDTADVDWRILDGLDAESVFSAMKEPTGHVERADSQISFVDSTRTFTIQPASTSFDYYIHGVKYTVTTVDNVVLPNVSNLYFVYYDSAGSLSYTNTFSADLILNYALCAAIYYNATTSEAVYFADERHGITMDGQTHLHFHIALGCQYISGLGLTNLVVDDTGDNNTHAQCAVEDGVIRDEDIEHDIYDTGGAVNVYDLEQELNPLAQIPVLYRVGVNGEWTKKAADDYPFIYNGTAGYTGTLPPYNEFTGATWQLTEVANNRYFLMHILATNDFNNPIVAIQGITEHQNKPAGREAALNEITQLSGLPFAEFTPIASLICQTATGYANTPKVRIRSTDEGDDYIDWRRTESFSTFAGGGGSNTDENVKVSANDTTTGYLNGKLVAGVGVTLTENNDAGDETLTIASSTVSLGDNAALLVALNSSITIPTSWSNVDWDLTHVENNALVLEHDNTNIDRLLIKETGLYLIAFSMSFNADSGEEDIQARVLIDDTTVIPGSLRNASEDDEVNDLSNTFPAELTAGSYITFQHLASGTGNLLEATSNFTVARLAGPIGADGAAGADGADGADGAPGSGSTINLADEGVLVTNSPHSKLNFVGSAVAVTDAGSGEATVTITGGATAKESFYAHNNVTTQVLTSTFVTAIIATNIRADAIFSNTLGEVTISKDTWVEVQYEITADSTSSRSSLECVLQVNGSDVPGSSAYGYHRNTTSGKDTATATSLINITSGDVVRVRIRETAGNILTVANACRLTIREID